MKATFNGTEFVEVSVIIEDERIEGIMCHDLKDENHDGDAVCTNAVKLPEDAVQAWYMLRDEYWENDFSIMDTVEII